MDKAYQHAPDRPWIFRTYAGHSTATKSNELYRGNLAKGQTGLSIAFDLPTQTAYDADHILSKGEVGKVGVPVKHLGDMRLLFDQLPLEEMNTSMTINAPAAWMLALYVALADERGDDRKKLRGTTQNDIVKEYLSRGTYVFPPEPSLRLISDMVSWCYTEVPKWNPMNVCSYHLQEAGATPEQELAYALATAISVLDTVKAGGQVPESDFETVFGRISFFVNAGVRFVTELCKMRAFVELWEEIGRERYGVTSPKALLFRYGVQVNSLGLTEPQPENNVYRILIEAMAVTLSKKARCRALQLPAWNEALGLPRPWDQQWSLRLQQILAYETDLLEYEDIFDGSHVIESKTEELKALARDTLADLDARGGAIQSIDHMKESLVGAHIDRIKAIESGDLTVVGVNRYVETAESPLAGGDGSIQTVDPAEESAQVRDLKEWRSKRDASAVENALAALKQAAQDGTNIMEPSIACAKAGVVPGRFTLYAGNLDGYQELDLLAAAARTTSSSLKAHKSSIEPPPRATINRSGRGTAPPRSSALKPRTAALTCPFAVSPCTSTGHTITWDGKRSSSRWSMSRITAPVGEVTTPMVFGRKGSGFLRVGSNSPSASSRALVFSSSASSAPSPASSIRSITIWYLERPA